MKDRPILLYPKIICSGCLVAIGMTLFNSLSQPGAIRDLLRFSTGRFSEFYTAVGVWVVLRFLYQCARLLWARNVSNDTFIRKSGSWAVVTGCTSGLGKEYTFQLASKGLNVVLISRNQTDLNNLGQEISDNYGVRVMTHAVDFASNSDNMYDVIEKKFASLDIGVLVNNAGVAAEPNYYHDVTNEEIMNIIRVNMTALAEMSRSFLPGMASRGRGIVINLASALGTTPAPFVAIYGASKRCADILTRALDLEYRDKGIFIQSVTPYFISTKMTKNVKTGPLIPDVKTFVRNHLTTVGRDSETYGYWPHTLEGWFCSKLPTPILRRLFLHMKTKSEKLTQKTQNGKH